MSSSVIWQLQEFLQIILMPGLTQGRQDRKHNHDPDGEHAGAQVPYVTAVLEVTKSSYSSEKIYSGLSSENVCSIMQEIYTRIKTRNFVVRVR